MIPSTFLVVTTFLKVVLLPLSAVISVEQSAVWIGADDSPNMCATCREFKTVDLFILSVLDESLTFTSNSRVYFQSGTHNIMLKSEYGLVVQDIANFSIEVRHTQTNNTTTGQLLIAELFCHTNFGFSFINMTNLRVDGIYFEGCVVSHNPSYALKIADSFNVSLHNVSISQSEGIGLYLLNVYTNLSLSYTQLTKNAINCYIQCYNIVQPDRISLQNTSYLIECSNISFGESCNDLICNYSSSGLTVIFNQTSFVVNLFISDVILQNNIGVGNVQITTTSCCKASVIAFTRVKLMAIHNVNKYAIAYHELQCIYEGSYPREITVSHSHVKRLCIYAKLHDNNGLNSGVSETHITFQNTSISNSPDSCISSLEVYNIHYVTLNNVEIKDGESPFILRVDNALRFKPSFYSVTLSGYCKFKNNKGGISFIGRQLKSTSKLIFMEESNISITYNKVINTRENPFGSTLSLSYIVVEFRNSCHVRFNKNKAYISGGITATGSNIQFIDNSLLEFICNSGKFGGAMALYGKSQLSFYSSNSTITFINNLATHYGGAIYIDDSSYFQQITNIFVAPFFFVFCCTPSLVFKMNKAGLGGSALYGGWIDWISNYNEFLNVKTNISCFLSIKHQEGDLSPIASEPLRICVCQNDIPDCTLTVLEQKIHPGETFSISAVAVGQRLGTVTSRVEARFNEETDSENPQIPKLGDLEEIQIVNQKCTSIKYSPRSSSKVEKLRLTVSNTKNIVFSDKTINELKKDPAYYLQFKQLSIVVEFLPCPFGFQFNMSLQVCECTQLPTSAQFNVRCDTSTFKLIRQENSWIGIDTKLDPGDNASIFGTCPFEFCDSRTVELSSVEDLDKQCNLNRSGILCGECRQNLSMVFGSLTCQDCSNKQIAPVLFVFAFSGVSVVMLLFALNLTISTGTLNSLAFYVNIIYISTTSFIPPSFLHSFLYYFVSVLNLGVGSEVCFYRGMDAYGKSWLRLAFLFYILILSMLIIIVSHYSTKVSKLLGRNPIQVLATLFLLSYAKFLEITVATSAIRFTTLQSADGKSLYHVWYLDGNVPYLSAKHALLFIATLFLVVFVCIPYALFLALIQPLQKYSHVCLFRWTNKLKPFIDAHTGPYKDKHRYWTGLLLFVRLGVVFLFSINGQGNQLINIALIAIIALCLTLYILAVRGIYKSRLLSIIEIFFMINLFLLSVSLFLQEIFSSRNQQESYWVVNTSAGLAFAYFCLVIVYHIWARVRATVLGKWITNATIKVKRKVNFSTGSSESDTTKQSKMSDKIPHAVTHSSVELREALLSDNSLI